MRIDLKRERKDLYQPGSADFVEVVVPPTTYLAIDGHGDPNTSAEYAAAVSALHAGAYAVRAVLKARTGGTDFVVGPLSGLWSATDPTAFVTGDKAGWDWTMLIPLPEVVSEHDIEIGLTTAAGKKPGLPLDRVHPLPLDEGRSLQIMHRGSYDDEAPTLARLHHEVMPALGLTWNGRHHEIYLNHPGRVSPERLRTVLRQPVRAGG